ncbi:uncharacterized protein [Parasteatoda tepidariorum]|nr:uncharacterized protein LOC107456465 [Parasteatoda tepidariorum]XP_042898768.1 uncharacterized protein LOC107456465 [Parasteatoda tepidariorum]XP_042898769.1 uncharacterized protein LOC107456465 [Parasteatoda tepidariorum]XP_042898770.1 uncharacterized protein LOC107456465 [Parasteatoda tepidariorum]
MVKGKSSYKLVRDFIVPSLEKQTYGTYLTWENKVVGSFKISRIHQNNEHFSQDCIKVYKDWSLRRNLWFPKDPKKITKAKHRLVTALRRSPEIEVLAKESSYYRFRFRGSNSTSKELSTSTSESHDGTVFEDKGENENIVLRIDINSDSLYCPHKEDTKRSNRHETNYSTLSEEFFRPSVIFKKIEESEIGAIQDIQVLPLVDNLNSSEDNNGSVLNNKCGCVALLDSNFLYNKRCIWHGAFP